HTMQGRDTRSVARCGARRAAPRDGSVAYHCRRARDDVLPRVMTLSSLVLIACALAASVRWLRVAQYEHYLAGSCARFALRWFRSSAANVVLGLALVAAAIGGIFWWRLLLPAAVLVVLWPLGLGLRGRTNKLRWTRRMRTLVIIGLVLAA